MRVTSGEPGGLVKILSGDKMTKTPKTNRKLQTPKARQY